MLAELFISEAATYITYTTPNTPKKLEAIKLFQKPYVAVVIRSALKSLPHIVAPEDHAVIIAEFPLSAADEPKILTEEQVGRRRKREEVLQARGGLDAIFDNDTPLGDFLDGTRIDKQQAPFYCYFLFLLKMWVTCSGFTKPPWSKVYEINVDKFFSFLA